MTTRKENFCLICIGVNTKGTFCSVLFGFRKCNKMYIYCLSSQDTWISSVTRVPQAITAFPFWNIKPINPMRAFETSNVPLWCYNLKIVSRVPVPKQLILDCYWLHQRLMEVLTDWSNWGIFLYHGDGRCNDRSIPMSMSPFDKPWMSLWWYNCRAMSNLDSSCQKVFPRRSWTIEDIHCDVNDNVWPTVENRLDN